MCEKVETALAMVKQRKNLAKGDILMVFQQVALDLGKQGERIKMIEERMTALEKRTNEGFVEISNQIKDLKKTIEDEHRSFISKIPILKDMPTLFWIFLIILVCGAFSLLGANLDFLKNIKFGG